MINNPKNERVEFVQSAHEYLAKNGFCSVNEGEFLLWSMNVLYDYSNNCEVCKESEEIEDAAQVAAAAAAVTNSENNTENSNNDDTEASTSNKASAKSKSKKSTANTNSLANVKKSSHCVTCEDVITELLEQSFLCCFGYKTKGNKYLRNHSVINIKYTLENCKHLYNYYRPEKLPEYDDLPFKSITAEVTLIFILKFFKIR